MSALRRLAAIGLAAILTAGCDESLSELAGPTPNLTPTFSSIQRDIFEARDASGRAACTECHNATLSRFNGLDLSSAVAHANLVNVASRGKPGAIRVIPGDPENSYLIHKLEGRAEIAGQRMPRGTGPFLTPGQMAILRRWIAQGAAND